MVGIRWKYILFCAAGVNRTPNACLFRSELDYIIILEIPGAGRLCEIIVGNHSLVSTPSEEPPLTGGPLFGLARDYFFEEVSPEFTQFLNPHYCEMPQRSRAALYH